MTDAEIKAIAAAAAEEAVAKMMLRLGFDPDSGAGEFAARRADFAYLRTIRLGSEIIKKQGLTTIVGVITTAVIAGLVAAFVKWSGWHPAS